MSQSGKYFAGSGAQPIETITGNNAVAIPPNVLGNINIVGDNVTVSVTGDAGTNTLTITAIESPLTVQYVQADPNVSPYIVQADDYYISCDTGPGAFEVRLPNNPAVGRIFVIKDRTGNAAANNITVKSVNGLVTIDGSTTLTINTDYQAVALIYNGSGYELY